MTGFEIFSVSGTLLVGLGLLATWVRNGRSQGRAYGNVESRLKSVEDKLDDPNTGLGSIKKAVDDQKVYCARVSSSHEERIKSIEGERRD